MSVVIGITATVLFAALLYWAVYGQSDSLRDSGQDLPDDLPDRVKPTKANVAEQLAGREIPTRQHVNYVNAYFGLPQFEKGEGPPNLFSACMLAENYKQYAVEMGWATREGDPAEWSSFRWIED